MLERSKGPKQGRRVNERVEATQLRLECVGNIGEIRGFRPRKIQRKDDRLRQLLCDDLVVKRFQLTHDTGVKDDSCTGLCACDGQDASQSARRASNKNDASIE